MPYKDILDLKGIAPDVMRYDKNVDFKPNLVQTEKGKRACAGQAFATLLITQQEWNVKAKEDPADFVVYKDCNKCNFNEYSAVEGKNMFTGYEKLANYIYKNGMVATVTKGSKEVQDILASIGLSCRDSNSADLRLSREENAALVTPPVTPPVPRDATARANHGTTAITGQSETENPSTASNCRSSNRTPNAASLPTPEISFEDFINKQKEIMLQSKQVCAKIDHARTTYTGNDDVTIFIRDKAVNFYNTLQRSLTNMAGEREHIKCYKPESIQVPIDAFENYLEELTKSEDELRIDFLKRIIESLVEETRDRFLPK